MEILQYAFMQPGYRTIRRCAAYGRQKTPRQKDVAMEILQYAFMQPGYRTINGAVSSMS